MAKVLTDVILPDGTTYDLNPGSGWLTSRLERDILGRAGGLGTDVAARTLRWPSATGVTRSAQQLRVMHRIEDGADHYDLVRRLVGDLYSGHGACRLRFTENGIEKEVVAAPIELARRDAGDRVCNPLGVYDGTWDLLDPVALAVTPTATGPAALSGGSPSDDVAVAGTVATRAVTYTLDPTAQMDAADGQRYRAQRTVVNRAPRPLVHWPVMVAQGWDHAAEVTATRSQADGDDVEVYVAGVRVSRWAHDEASRGWNDAAADLWINMDLPPGRSWTARASALSGDLVLYVEEELIRMPALPFAVVIDGGAGDEVAWVTDYDALTRSLTVVRAGRSTSAVAVAAGDPIWWAPAAGHVDVVWGWTSAPAQTYVDDEAKPIILERTAAQTNDGWTFTAFYEGEASGDAQRRKARAASWYSRALGAYDRERKVGDGDMFWRWCAGSPAAPATSLTVQYQSEGAKGGRPLIDRWELASPIAISAYGFDWTADTIKYYDSGSGDLEGKLHAYYVAADGAVVKAGEYDDTVALGGGSGSESITLDSANVGAIVVGFRIEPFDPKTWTAATLIALEPADGDGWSVDNVAVTFATAERVLIAGSMTRHDIYQIGRPDDPASLATTAGTVRVLGVVLRLTETLVLDADAQTAVVDGAEPDRGVSHLLSGRVPPLPADTGLYPVAGAATVTYDAPAITGISLSVSHRDAWGG